MFTLQMHLIAIVLSKPLRNVDIDHYLKFNIEITVSVLSGSLRTQFLVRDIRKILKFLRKLNILINGVSVRTFTITRF